jgi:dolichol kinase
MSPLWQEVAGTAILGAVFLTLLAVAEVWKRKTQVRPETTRKFVHVFGGLACVSFPFIFASAWTILALAAALFLIIVGGRELGFLNSLHGVARKTSGSEYYPFAIFLLFVLTRAQPWLYVCAVLVLAVADAFAALIGTHYGEIRYEVENDSKSLEGSLVFGVIAFLAIHLPLLLMTDLPRPTCVLAAVLTATLVTGFEAISLRGTDNLFVPLAVAVILSKITTKPLPEIVYQNVSLCALCLVIGIVCWRSKSLNVGGSIAMMLFAYGAWSLGSEWWAVPILTGFFAYALVWLSLGNGTPLKVSTVFHALAFPLLTLVAANMLHWEQKLYAPFVAMLVVVLGISVWHHVSGAGLVSPRRRTSSAVLTGTIASLTGALLPWISPGRLAGAGFVFLTVIAAVTVFLEDVLMQRSSPQTADEGWPARRVLLTLAAGLVVMTLQGAGLMGYWTP